MPERSSSPSRRQRAELAAAIGGAERLRRVVEHLYAVRGGDRRDGIVIGRQAEQVDRDHGFRLQAAPLRRRDSALKACRIEIEGVGGDVGHDRRRANERHHFGGGAKRKRRADHRVARPDLPRHQHQQQRVGAARTADDMLGAAEGREVGLERAHFRPLDELAMVEHAADRVVDGAAETAALGGNVDERDRAAVEAGMLIHLVWHARSADNAARSLARRARLRGARAQAADRDFEAGDGFLAGHRGRSPPRMALMKATSSERSGSA